MLSIISEKSGMTVSEIVSKGYNQLIYIMTHEEIYHNIYKQNIKWKVQTCISNMRLQMYKQMEIPPG